MQLRSFAFSHIGRVRPENEDSFLCDDGRQLYAVADGIGGLPAGAQASQKAIAVLTQLITPVPPPKNLNYGEILQEINQQVFSRQQHQSCRCFCCDRWQRACSAPPVS